MRSIILHSRFAPRSTRQPASHSRLSRLSKARSYVVVLEDSRPGERVGSPELPALWDVSFLSPRDSSFIVPASPARGRWQGATEVRRLRALDDYVLSGQ